MGIELDYGRRDNLHRIEDNRVSAEGSGGSWVCLMYHEIPATEESAGGYFAVPAAAFAEQMSLLRRRGLLGESLERVVTAPAENRVAITFDDGHHTHYESAFPILREHGFRATFFVTTSWVGTAGYVTWAQLREMAAAGMSIQSHTHSHPFLSTLDSSGVERELGESKRLLDEELGQQTVTLALPNGDPPRPGLGVGPAEAGYRIVATSQWGTNRGGPAEGVTSVRRYTVRSDTSVARFDQLATGRSPAWSLEGLRLRGLNGVRRLLGPERYSRWRRTILSTLRG